MCMCAYNFACILAHVAMHMFVWVYIYVRVWWGIYACVCVLAMCECMVCLFVVCVHVYIPVWCDVFAHVCTCAEQG